MKSDTVIFDTPWGNFEWDSEKEQTNILKHGVDFEAACEIFADSHAAPKRDEAHSLFEERSSLTGKTKDGVFLLLVIFTERERTRIISARKANKKERKEYVSRGQKIRSRKKTRNSRNDR